MLWQKIFASLAAATARRPGAHVRVPPARARGPPAMQSVWAHAVALAFAIQVTEAQGPACSQCVQP